MSSWGLIVPMHGHKKTTNNSFLVSTATNEALTANLGVPTCLNNSAVQIVCLAIPCDYRKLATTKVIKTWPAVLYNWRIQSVDFYQGNQINPQTDHHRHEPLTTSSRASRPVWVTSTCWRRTRSCSTPLTGCSPARRTRTTTTGSTKCTSTRISDARRLTWSGFCRLCRRSDSSTAGTTTTPSWRRTTATSRRRRRRDSNRGKSKSTSMTTTKATRQPWTLRRHDRRKTSSATKCRRHTVTSATRWASTPGSSRRWAGNHWLRFLGLKCLLSFNLIIVFRRHQLMLKILRLSLVM